MQYPERLDLRQCVSEQKAGLIIYLLYAARVHPGRKCHSGHHFCYIKAGNGQWYKMDDTSDVTSALSEHAYVFFDTQMSELERDHGSEPASGETTSLQADHADVAVAQGGVRGGSHGPQHQSSRLGGPRGRDTSATNHVRPVESLPRKPPSQV